MAAPWVNCNSARVAAPGSRMPFRAVANRLWRIDPMLKFLESLQSWPLFVLVAALFGVDPGDSSNSDCQ